MYEQPKLNVVGNAQDVILGIVPSGNDVDLNFVGGDIENADDGSSSDQA